jgi:hypothetical protein
MATGAKSIDQSRDPRHGAPRDGASRCDELGDRLLHRLSFEAGESIRHIDNDERRIERRSGELLALLDRVHAFRIRQQGRPIFIGRDHLMVACAL